jgi:hypothetical protein
MLAKLCNELSTAMGKVEVQRAMQRSTEHIMKQIRDRSPMAPIYWELRAIPDHQGSHLHHNKIIHRDILCASIYVEFG